MVVVRKMQVRDGSYATCTMPLGCLLGMMKGMAVLWSVRQAEPAQAGVQRVEADRRQTAVLR